ncbi:hypothetical protein [Tenacibaculum singaporense]|uniref:Uncharacterized protein n=1 Tax=Tenacibaculum singaporense TaxID=2358479 RepID=A0A3S8RAJ2_9FLAO|nr:hypothetical protein [Tenacibaculum singaporense]AZJ36777.1 hypothetical protein D6T69_15020 [Tenacibaculum singaporense]
MNYTREKLNSINAQSGKPVDFDKIVQTLANKVFANEEISLAEEQFVCPIIENLRNYQGEKELNIQDYNSCKNYLFRNKYLLYFSDLNGHKKVYDFDGEIPVEKKRVDVSFLQKEYDDWNSFISNKLNGSELINYVSQETKNQIKKLDKYCEKLSIGTNRKKYLKKSLTLHGKYIYLLVKEFYQELGKDEEIIELNGEKILIDGFTYVHTMFRHYSEQIKEHQTEKSYHFDKNIGFKSIPDFLLKAIKCYQKTPESNTFNNKCLNIIFNDRIYAIWFRPYTKYLKGNKRINYYRVQTFYPVENKNDLDKLNSYKQINTDCGFSYLIENIT